MDSHLNEERKMYRTVDDIGVASQIAAYSYAIEVSPNLRWRRTSGTAGLSTDVDLPKEIGGQAELAWGHVVRMLGRASMTVADILKVTQYLTRAEDIPAYGKVRTRFLGTVAAICATLAFAVAGPASAHGGQTETVTPKFDQAIPNIPGKSLITLEVDYAPGAASAPHRHAKSAFIYAYVISGEIESKVNNGETRIYKAGESWSEPPNANHPISRNASKTKPAKLLAVFVVDSDDKPLTSPVK